MCTSATVAIVTGACGTANQIYPATATGFGNDTFCVSGTQSPSVLTFPIA